MHGRPAAAHAQPGPTAAGSILGRQLHRLIRRLAPLLLIGVLSLATIPAALAGPIGSAAAVGSEPPASKTPASQTPAPLIKVTGPSPAQTIERFQSLTDGVETIIRRAIHQGMAEPGFTFSSALQRRVDASIDTLLQATEALDLSQVPQALRPMTGVGMMLMLRSVLSYDLSHDPDLVVPDQAQTERQHLTHWTIPDTTLSLRAITQKEAEAGLLCTQCSAGDFLFSAGTLNRVPAAFERIFGNDPQLRRRHGADLYVYWAKLPGGALPPKSFLRLPVAVRRVLLTPIAGQSLLQWLVMLPFTLIALAGMIWWLSRMAAWHHQRSSAPSPWPHLLRAAAILPPLLLVEGWQWFAITWVNLTDTREASVLVISNLATGLLLALLVYLLAEAIGQMLTLRRQIAADGSSSFQRRSGAGQILTLVRSVGVGGALVIGVRTGQELGLTSLTLLALSSVPALAISLGTQQLIRDISDGFSLLLDGQIRTGDRCSVRVSSSSEIQGCITSLGMRSARLQQDDGSILTIPNSQLASSLITTQNTNVSRPLNLRVPTAASEPLQLQSLLEQVRQILTRHGAIARAQADLEPTEQGWAVQVKGWWQPELSRSDRAMARERLLLELLQLLGSGGSP